MRQNVRGQPHVANMAGAPLCATGHTALRARTPWQVREKAQTCILDLVIGLQPDSNGEDY
jgi:hypothetical protein